MADLLPVLYEHTPQMTACAYCPEPGHCCTGFSITQCYGGAAPGEPPTFWGETWEADAKAYLAESNLPFVPERIAERYIADGREYVTIKFGCEHLADGRCGIYATRPKLCRNYEPGHDKLCVLG